MLEIRPIPAFDDNYIWMLQSAGSDRVVVVDPGDEEPVLDALRRQGLTLEAILITHKHGDHTGGVQDLIALYPQAEVFGPTRESIKGITRPVVEGDRIVPRGLEVTFEVMDVPGHTEGHVAYYGEGALFCGDTLFTGGCGRVFSGTHRQLHASLQRIAALPPQTRIYCAHEYTADNLGFAQWVEPDNPRLQERRQQTDARRSRGEPTVPSSLELELATNPFLRTGEPLVVAAAEKFAGRAISSEAEVFTMIRTWKDREYD